MDPRFLEASPDCVKLVSLDGRLEYMNANGRCLMEVSDFGLFKGREWADLWPEAEQPRVRAAIRDACAGQVTRFSAFCPTALGTPRWWDVVVSPLVDASGAVEMILSISRDITHLKLVERGLKESEQRFRALADTIPQLAWMADPTGAVFWYNERWYEYTGTTFDQMKGMGWRQVHHPEHVDRVVEKYLDCLSRGEEWEDVFPLRGADGEYRWFLSRAMPQRNEQGVAELYCGTNTDITEQRNQSQRLRQLARIMDLSHEAILVWDLEKGIVSWNRGCEELYGYTKAEAIGAVSHQLLDTRLPVPPADFERLLLFEGSWSGELLQSHADGSEVWVESRQELIRVAGRRLIIETNRDVTERRRADEIRNLLVAELNHRVKNALAIVQSLATQTSRNAPSVEAFLAGFNNRLQSLASAHNVLTDADWVGASILQLVHSQIALRADDCHRISICGEDVTLPPQTALQFTLILHELMTNAVKHGALARESGRIEIGWNVRPGDPPQLEFSWRERGVPQTAAPRDRGFGLTLIERSGRLPNIQSRVAFAADGIEAFVSAPLTHVEQKAAELFNPGKRLMRPRLAGAARSSKLVRDRILIVEREPHDAMLLEDMLYDAGYVTIGPVTRVEDVRRKLDTVTCDLAIVDADGARAEVEAAIEMLEGRGVPCVLIGSVRRLAEAPELGSKLQRLTKPLQSQLLLSALATAIAVGRKGSISR